MKVDGTDLKRADERARPSRRSRLVARRDEDRLHEPRDRNFEIYVMNADGTSQARRTNNSAIDIEPEWSPDGTKLSFTSTRTGAGDIYVVDATGSTP